MPVKEFEASPKRTASDAYILQETIHVLVNYWNMRYEKSLTLLRYIDIRQQIRENLCLLCAPEDITLYKLEDATSKYFSVLTNEDVHGELLKNSVLLVRTRPFAVGPKVQINYLIASNRFNRNVHTDVEGISGIYRGDFIWKETL